MLHIAILRTLENRQSYKAAWDRGYKTGFKEGQVIGYRKCILLWGKKHIGPITQAQLREFEAIDDPDRLYRMIEQWVDPTSWKQVLEVT